MSTLSLVSRNPHAHCDSGSPCPTCAPKYQPVMPSIAGKTPQQVAAEQAARERHPAGADLPTPLTYRVDWADYEVVIDTPDATLRLDESMLAELTARLTNPEPCDWDVCYEPAEDGGLCVAHRDAADALPSGGWRK